VVPETGAPVNAQYVFDTPKKQEMYSALLEKFTQLYGAADGAKLAAADSGHQPDANFVYVTRTSP